MKIPRDITGQELLKLLRKHYGYEKIRQVGSHIRATTQQNGVHPITVPDHDPIKIGTLNSIISEVADHFGLSKNEVLSQLFG
jgi:predicted RNA binding protein YcfA (HicA-like mRNA interferase family)